MLIAVETEKLMESHTNQSSSITLYTGYVYKVYCEISKKVYIGITTNTIDIRRKQHENESYNPNSSSYKNHFHTSLRKYGLLSFEWTILEEITSSTKENLIECLNLLEIKYIKLYDTYQNGYNSTLGGELKGNLGCEKKVKVYKEDGVYLGIFDSLKETSIKFNTLESSISDCCRKVIYTSGKYENSRLIFRYEDDDFTQEEIERIKYVPDKSPKSVVCYNYRTGEKLNRFDKVIDAQNYYNTDSSAIIKVCTYRMNTSGRIGDDLLTWRYEGDDYIMKYKMSVSLKDGIILNKFVDDVSAANAYNITLSALRACLCGKSKSSGRLNGEKLYWTLIKE